MGNKHCRLCVSSSSPPIQRKSGLDKLAYRQVSEAVAIDGIKQDNNNDASTSPSNLQHISDRERVEDWDENLTPSDHAKAQSIFIQKSHTESGGQKRSGNHISPGSALRNRRSSCSTVYIDDSTVSQPNIKASIKCVALAVFYHIKHPADKEKLTPDIFDEKLHPLTRDHVSSDYSSQEPDHRQIYRFIRTLFNAAQLTAECAIVTLIYVERLLSYAEILLCPANWKRVLLGSILLASKVWDDQAVWNVDYCQILQDVSVDSMNEMERKFLEFINFNINVPSSVYAKYYFDLRTLAEKQSFLLPAELLDKNRARRLEATSRSCEAKFRLTSSERLPRSFSTDHLVASHYSNNTSIVLS